MSLHNLATVFGPTLLRPSEGESKGHLTLASDIWSHDVMAQVRAMMAAWGHNPHWHPWGKAQGGFPACLGRFVTLLDVAAQGQAGRWQLCPFLA